MDKQERELLKHDRFSEEVFHGVDYAREHRRQVLTWVGSGILLIALGFAGWYYRGTQQTERQAALREGLKIEEAQVGMAQSPNPYFLTFATQEEKDRKAQEVFNNIASKYSGTDEGAVAEYYLGVNSATSGKLGDAETHLKKAIDAGSKEYASQAKLALATVYNTQGKTDDAEKLLRDLVASPTAMVSKEQATINLARVIAKKKPDEARKLLEPLRTERPAISKVALMALSELPKK